MNKSGLISEKFDWQDEYYVKSVSPEGLHRVKAYIDNQEAHHRIKSFTEEVEGFFKEGDVKNLPY